MGNKSPKGHVSRTIITPESSIGSVPSPSTNKLLNELKNLMAYSLIKARDSSIRAKDLAIIVGHLTRSLSNICSLEKLNELKSMDLAKMSDKEISEYTNRLISSLTN